MSSNALSQTLHLTALTPANDYPCTSGCDQAAVVHISLLHHKGVEITLCAWCIATLRSELALLSVQAWQPPDSAQRDLPWSRIRQRHEGTEAIIPHP
jgi:hypothetical protein